MDKIETLRTMLEFCRPYGGATEGMFIEEYVSNLPGAEKDPYGNWHVQVGENPTVLFSCHTDTVANGEGFQEVMFNPRTGSILLDPLEWNRQDCLGGDDTVGVFLLREMVLAGVPGYYVFHYGEEVGCKGSRKLAELQPDLLKKFSAAIAFDRMGSRDIITHQMGRRTASKAFAKSLMRVLRNVVPTLKHKPSNQGVYTDTAQYASLIPECTNVACGYEDAHSPYEYIDAFYVMNLLEALLQFDASKLVIKREAGHEDPLPRRDDKRSSRVFLDSTPLLRLKNDDMKSWDRDFSLDDSRVYLDDNWREIQKTLREQVKKRVM